MWVWVFSFLAHASSRLFQTCSSCLSFSLPPSLSAALYFHVGQLFCFCRLWRIISFSGTIDPSLGAAAAQPFIHRKKEKKKNETNTRPSSKNYRTYSSQTTTNNSQKTPLAITTAAAITTTPTKNHVFLQRETPRLHLRALHATCIHPPKGKQDLLHHPPRR